MLNTKARVSLHLAISMTISIEFDTIEARDAFAQDIDREEAIELRVLDKDGQPFWRDTME